MTTRDGFNRVVDGLLSLKAWQWKLIALVASVAIAAGFITRHDAGLREDGRQEIRDSVAASTALRLHKKVEASQAAADLALSAARDSARSLRRAQDQFAESMAELAQADFRVPAVQVIGDSIHMADDSTVYVVPRPIANWVVAADARLTRQDSLIRYANVLLTQRVPAMVQQYEKTVGALQAANLNLDSLVSAGLAENRALKRRLASSQPSKFQTILYWTKEAGKACAFISIGRGKPCWAR